MRTIVRDLSKHIDETVTVCGWVNAVRAQRKIQFVIVRDDSGMVQTTLRRGQDEAMEALIDKLHDESAVRVTGRVVANEVVSLGGIEIVPERFEVLGAAEAPLPIDRNTGPEQRLDWRYLDLRLRPEQRQVLAVQSTVEQAMRDYVFSRGFVELHTPKLMGTASESGAEVFKLEYFDRAAYLAQSPQFYKQMAIAAGFEQVFEVGPVFRAEPSFTSRHSTEFTGVDIEFAWIDGVEDVMDLEEEMIAGALRRVEELHGDQIFETFSRKVKAPDVAMPRIRMDEAIELLRSQGWDPEGQRAELDPEGERRLSAHFLEQTGSEFVFVTHYPSSVRPFYHMRPEGDPDTTLSFDLLWNGLEITTGAQREHRYDVLCAQAEEKGMALEPLRQYLDAFRFGTPPHGGLGLGLGRFTMTLLGLESIRDTSFLFRGPNRLTP
ncbi:MAG TPA: aspartate--tRNA(Asn) ligase [Glycomyces sp.]|nr:aspartate--tRNA(Asn) ligase [Glycomyces sp.]